MSLEVWLRFCLMSKASHNVHAAALARGRRHGVGELALGAFAAQEAVLHLEALLDGAAASTLLHRRVTLQVFYGDAEPLGDGAQRLTFGKDQGHLTPRQERPPCNVAADRPNPRHCP